jgi:hypothetical protein
MDFSSQDEQRMMASAFRELSMTSVRLLPFRAAFEGRSDESHARWSRIVEMGLPGTLAPEVGGRSRAARHRLRADRRGGRTRRVARAVVEQRASRFRC